MMSSLRSLSALAVCTLSVLTACGFSTTGLRDGSGGSTASTDATGTASSSASTSGGGHAPTGSSSSSSSSGPGTGGQGGMPPMCGTSECVTVPDGWTLVVAKTTDANATPDTCAGGSTATIYHTSPAGPPTCTACECETTAAAACTAPTLLCSLNKTDCTATDLMVSATSTSCTSIDNIPANASGSCKITGPATANPGDACTATGGQASTDPMWGGAFRVCALPPGPAGCAAGQICASNVSTNDGGLCITKPGDDTCPNGWTQGGDSTFADGDDKRSCASCGCSVTCSGGGYVIHDHSDCTDPDLTQPAVPVKSDGTCTVATGMFDNTSGAYTATLGTPAATCTGGQPMGQVNGKMPQRICCR